MRFAEFLRLDCGRISFSGMLTAKHSKNSDESRPVTFVNHEGILLRNILLNIAGISHAFVVTNAWVTTATDHRQQLPICFFTARNEAFVVITIISFPSIGWTRVGGCLFRLSARQLDALGYLQTGNPMWRQRAIPA
jgi:hypothetical protein